jgi:integrase
MKMTPKEPRAARKAEPWSVLELNRIVMAARKMPEFVGGIAGRYWWPAMILLILDIDVSAENAVRLPSSALDSCTGRISYRNVLFQLHAKTLEALNALPRDRKFLLPWPKDSGRPPFHMLYRDYKTVLYRAGVPCTTVNSFVRLQVTARRIPDVLDRVQPILNFVCHAGKPQLLRARDRRRHLAAADRELKPTRVADDSAKLDPNIVDVNPLVPNSIECSDNPAALLNVFRARFQPKKLKQATDSTIAHYVRSVNLLYSFAGRELTTHELTDELLNAFLQDCQKRGVHTSDCDHFRRDLQALRRCGLKASDESQGIGAVDRSGQTNLLSPKQVPCTDNPAALLNVFRSKYRPTKLRQATDGTAAHYERTITLLYSFAGRELMFQDLTDELVEDFLTDCFEQGVKAGTCNHYRADLLALWRFGWKKRFTNELPRDVPKLKVEQQLVDAWTTAELERIIDAALQRSGDVCDIPARVWWPAFILALYDTGLRFNALMMRPTTDLDINTGWLSVEASDQKQRKAQALKLHSDTLRFIRSMEPANRALLFPWPNNSGQAIRDIYREILKAAGLPNTKRDLFHKLRRTSATSVAAATDENTARDHLGHSSVIITRRYLDQRQIQPVAAADLINRPRVGCLERR